MTQFDCERLREVGPELALGIADGEDRAAALDHLAECGDCRARVERLSAVADELLLLAPAVDPPAGFEQRVVDAQPAKPRRPSLLRRFAIPAVAAAAAAAIAGFVVWNSLSDDRQLADSYRATLAVANGEYFDAAPLEAPGGAKVGYVYGYQGRASWVLAIVYDGVKDGRYRLDVVSTKGEREVVQDVVVRHGDGSEGGVTRMPYESLAEARLLDAHGRQIASAELHHSSAAA
jgi:hypothetical protein